MKTKEDTGTNQFYLILLQIQGISIAAIYLYMLMFTVYDLIIVKCITNYLPLMFWIGCHIL